MTCNPEKSLENSDSRDFTSKYSSPFPLLEFEERKKSLEIDKVLPLEENLQSLLQRLQEAQTKSIQNRMSLINDLTKEKKNFEKEVEISLKQDDLVQFFTNNGELRTLNEENIEMENYIEENKLNEISTSPNQKFANSPKPKNQNQKSLQMGSNYNNNTKYNNIDKNLKVKDNEDNVDFLEEIGSEGLFH